jgi:hypothetical protein
VELLEEMREGAREAINKSVAFRVAEVERILMRMIKRNEFGVILIDENVQGRPMGDALRLNGTLAFDVHANTIGYNGLRPGYRWVFSADAKSVHEALEKAKALAWNTNESNTDWLVTERYLRALFEVRGLPDTREAYVGDAASWYSERYGLGEEPATSELRNLTSRLYEEYSYSENSVP